VAILSKSEFEAIIGNVINRIEKELVARGSVPALETAKEELVRIRANAGDGAKLKAARKKLDQSCDAILGEIHEEPTQNQLWDLLDYVDYRA